MIAIIDYSMGNLRSVQKGFEKMGHAATVTRDAVQIEEAGGVVLPGVGAFGACMDGLAECGLVDTVHRVVERGTPFLGICVGDADFVFGEYRVWPGPGTGYSERQDRAV